MSGFWDGVGEFVSGIASPVTTLGGQWLKNRGDISKAAAELKIAELKARGELAKDKMALEMKTLDGAQRLDFEAMKQKAQSWFDEILTCLILTPVVITVYDPVWGREIFDALKDIPLPYQLAVLIIMIDRFALRALLRYIIKLYLNKRLPGHLFGRGPEKPEEAKGKDAV